MTGTILFMQHGRSDIFDKVIYEKPGSGGQIVQWRGVEISNLGFAQTGGRPWATLDVSLDLVDAENLPGFLAWMKSGDTSGLDINSVANRSGVFHDTFVITGQGKVTEVDFRSSEDLPHGTVSVKLELSGASITTHMTDDKGNSTPHSTFSWT